ncbi:hypothetical protein MWU60_12815 [Yoonia sp. F2084L]|uniref:hypothetical protein n=1 Tax=Yoonia sp. F2084L TaxID=2926419 RepID=UPI001FF2E3BB|nr:hypothetical protein [Yoonia sp. F2084L]MCK0096457.1 hypothetical protein [Yoonia sp. F2084L]
MPPALEHNSIADRLALLAEQRRENQIGRWEFEQSKRDVLNLPRSRISPIVRNLLACLIVDVTLLGLTIAFPAYVKMVALVVLLIVAYLAATGWYVFSNIDRARRDSRHLWGRDAEWDDNMRNQRWRPFIFNKQGRRR